MVGALDRDILLSDRTIATHHSPAHSLTPSLTALFSLAARARGIRRRRGRPRRHQTCLRAGACRSHSTLNISPHPHTAKNMHWHAIHLCHSAGLGVCRRRLLLRWRHARAVLDHVLLPAMPVGRAKHSGVRARVRSPIACLPWQDVGLEHGNLRVALCKYVAEHPHASSLMHASDL